MAEAVVLFYRHFFVFRCMVTFFVSDLAWGWTVIPVPPGAEPLPDRSWDCV